jgi:hypothetical protein
MADGMDLERLHQLVGGVVAGLKDMHTHTRLGQAFVDLGLPRPPDEGTKAERVSESFAALPDADLPMVAEQILAQLSVGAKTRNAIQDVLWASQSVLEIPKRTRREIARDLDIADLVRHADRFMTLLDRLWVLDDDLLGFFTAGPTGLRADIEQHVFRNLGDWTTEELFERLGVFEAADGRVIRFLEGLVSPETVPDEPAQRHIIDTVNPHLRAVGAELRETDTDGGYPVFGVISIQAARNRQPKNLIFASQVKPDIRFRDAVNNDIEIVSNADKALVYEDSIGGGGLRWRDLQAWWAKREQIADDAEAKESLYKRLVSSLPDNSPPQQNLYHLYHQIHGPAVPDLPALLPEVWLYWDPKTVKARGVDALLRFRMDFLMLLPHNQRVVIEVDGAHHFTAPNGKPDGAKYAANMRGDRDLKLSGYEVFRFGATELQGYKQARSSLEVFFADLFRRFEVTLRGN